MAADAAGAKAPGGARHKSRGRWKIRLLALFFIFIVLEGLLQIITLASPLAYDTLVPGAVQAEVVDPELGQMPNPRYAGHDDWGFRNEQVPSSTEVVALGDSQTYGMGVLPSSAWPAVLDNRGRATVYRMAFGGWGQVKQRAMLPRALSLQPRVILVALYLGNDFLDCYHRVYRTDRYPDLRNPDATVREALSRADQESPIFEPWEQMVAKESSLKTVLRDLSKRIRLIGLAKKTFDVIRGKANQELTGGVSDDEWQSLVERADQSEAEWPFAAGRVRTIFTPTLRQLALDPQDPRVREGCRISLAALEDLSKRAREKHVKLAVLLIPTKESAFRQLVAASSTEAPALYTELVAQEAAWRDRVTEFLEQRGVPLVDTQPLLSAALAAGELPYAATSDGHPTPRGHELIADAAAKLLDQD